nr:uncharacterized protein LOC111507408 [Leptinotarsa decemlineata]
MVRNNKKKGAKPVYTEVDLQNALEAVRARKQSMYAASKAFHIPYSSLYARATGLRCKISKGKGRPTTIPHDEEVELANGIRTLEKWGFGLSRREVLELVGSYVNKNDIVTKFKDGTPGEEWFLEFRKRHHLSLKVPQNVEYYRKKALDPFTIHNYFSLLKSTLDELNLHNKPSSQNWNLDETSLSIDPRKSKVVGGIGKPSSRTISSPGKENTTILVMCNAAGGKAPPLIIFKGRHLWDKWIAPEVVSYPGTVYAATKKGWMESDVFRNHFMKTIIPALGDKKPALIVYDGHRTHIDPVIIESDIRENITILKLPPHSH